LAALRLPSQNSNAVRDAMLPDEHLNKIGNRSVLSLGGFSNQLL
jgi:hypothetical protein